MPSLAGREHVLRGSHRSVRNDLRGSRDCSKSSLQKFIELPLTELVFSCPFTHDSDRRAARCGSPIRSEPPVGTHMDSPGRRFFFWSAFMATANLAKVTYFFGDGRYGWSETYYCLGQQSTLKPSGIINPLLTLPAAIQLAKARAAMLAAGAATCNFSNPALSGSVPSLEYIRISQVGQQRNTAFYDPESGEIINSQNIAPSIATSKLQANPQLTGYGADNPYSAMEMLLNLGNGLVSKRALSGIPDVSICDQSWSNSTSPWYKLWKGFAVQLTNGTWGVASNSIVANDVNVTGSQPIGLITQNALGQPVISLTVPLSFATGVNGCPVNYVQWFCYKSAPGSYPNLNGVYPVAGPIQVSGSLYPYQYTILRSFKPINPSRYGSVLPYPGPTFTPIVAATLTRPIAKKRGRPFGLVRGRARVVR